MASLVSSNINRQAGDGSSHSRSRQTRTNPSRTSKTRGRLSFGYGNHLSAAESAAKVHAAQAPHGFYPALTHFTDAITALPREFRRHNSLLKEVDAKAWALEESLLQLLPLASELQAVPYPPNPAPIVAGVVREDILPKDPAQPPESDESKNRRLLFDRVRYTLSDLMMTADEKNHVINNANEELDRQLLRLNTIFPYIAGEISEEARLGSLTHWAYSTKVTTKAAANERPRRETASNKHDLAHVHYEAEPSSRSEARREALLARKQRRAHTDLDFDTTRPSASRRTAVGKSRGGSGAGGPEHTTVDHSGHTTGGAGPSSSTKRRKVERPAVVEVGTAMERSASAAGTAGGRAPSKDNAGSDAARKRPRAPHAGSTTARQRKNTGTTVGSPVLASSPVIGTFSMPRTAASPGPNVIPRPQTSQTQQNCSETGTSRQRPSSSTSARAASISTLPGTTGSLWIMPPSDAASNTDKTSESKAAAEDVTSTADTALASTTAHVEAAAEPAPPGLISNTIGSPRIQEASDVKPERTAPEPNPTDTAGPSNAGPTMAPSTSVPKGRSSKVSTPVLATFSEIPQPRSRQTRNSESVQVALPAPAQPTTSRRTSHKRTVSSAAAKKAPAVVTSEDEESYLEGDEEDEEGEPRYCYCNGVSFGDMIACDNDACPREWFHLECLKMSKPPAKNVKWYCNECKENMSAGANAKRSRNGK